MVKPVFRLQHRGLNNDDYSQDQKPLSFHEIECIGCVEHNRWNVEKLLMGYRKAKPSEDKYNHNAYVNEWKSNKKNFYIHYDIRPFNLLDEVKQLDFDIAMYIPWIISMTEE